MPSRFPGLDDYLAGKLEHEKVLLIDEYSTNSRSHSVPSLKALLSLRDFNEE